MTTALINSRRCDVPRMLAVLTLVAVVATSVRANPPVLVEDFEFATTDNAAAAGVVDLTDFPNQPAFYENGDAPDGASQGLHSIGTEAVFCINPNADCVPGTFIGFRRYRQGVQFPATCTGGHHIPLSNTYGDPAHPGPTRAAFPLAALTVLCDIYGDGEFAGGPTGTHFWVNLVDCEGEVYEFVNLSETGLYSIYWTLDVAMGQDLVRLSPQSLSAVPNGDRLLTEIAAIEVFIQDSDDPPTTIGDWYIDNLRVAEPNAPGDWDGDGDVDLLDYGQLRLCLQGPNVAVGAACLAFDSDHDGDVDLHDVAAFQRNFSG